MTPLYAAVNEGHIEIVKLLLANNADVNAADKDGNTPLHRVFITLMIKDINGMVELLLSHKADVNAMNNKGETPLRLAIARGNNDMAELLRQHGGHE